MTLQCQFSDYLPAFQCIVALQRQIFKFYPVPNKTPCTLESVKLNCQLASSPIRYWVDSTAKSPDDNFALRHTQVFIKFGFLFFIQVYTKTQTLEVH